MLPDVEALPADEELTSGSRRPQLIAGLLAVALVAGLLVTRFVEQHGPAPAPRPTVGTIIGPPPRTYALASDPQAGCPAAGDGQTVCTTSGQVPPAVLAAVRARFPQARRKDALDERLRDVGFGPGGLWYRALSVTDGALSVVIVVRQRIPGDGPPFDRRLRAAGVDRIQVTRLAGRHAVVVDVIAPRTQSPSLHVVRALALDPRLLTAPNT